MKDKMREKADLLKDKMVELERKFNEMTDNAVTTELGIGTI